MACCEVKSLIKFLRSFGGDVISGQTKFTVTPEILKEINEITQSIKEDIYVSPLTNTDLINKYSSNDDLMFFYDFIKKTPKLKISNTVSSHKFTLSVSDFNNLKYLELYKFNVKYVRGIQLLRENLEMVVCVRCLDKVSDLLLSSDGNAYMNSIPSIWNKLRHAVLSRNSLTSLDESFIHTPWLQYLDISYNNLDDIQPLTCLRNLTHLNASYNHLKEIPKFAMYKLKVLILNNNYLSDITGISTLESLQECNLSDNCIAEHANLISLAELSWLQSLNIQGNPLTYHPMHRSLTCGYLHESVANKNFLLDNRPFTNAEREFIRYSSRGNTVPSNASSTESIVGVDDLEPFGVPSQGRSKVVKKAQKRPCEAKIENCSFASSNLSNCGSVESSLTITRNEESDDEEIMTLKEHLKALRKEQGADFWLGSKSAKKVEDLIGVKYSKDESPEEDTPQDSQKIVLIKKTNNILSDEGNISDSGIDEKQTSNNEVVTSEADSDAKSVNSTDDKNLDSGDSEEETSSDTSYGDIISKKNPWVVRRITDHKEQDVFLILNGSVLEEADPVKMNVISRWSIDCIERYIKISNEPFTLKLIFDVIKRNDRQRTFAMEYADAQELMKRIDTELESRHFHRIINLQCMKCDALFCLEKPKRPLPGQPPVYVCTTCQSKAVVQVISAAKDEKEYPYGIVNTPSKSAMNEESRGSNVTQSPSLSSIGSAASLDQNLDSETNDVSHTSHQESDIEVVSNPSESSVEIIAQEPNRSTETKSVFQRLSKTLSISEISTGDSVPADSSQMLTESSSSGSMTDSSCTTIESNYLNRGPHRISQSIDETLLEESSSVETSPQQRDTEERPTTVPGIIEAKYDAGIWDSFSGVLSSVKGALMLPSSIPRKNDQDVVLSTPFEYSFTDFASVDHRIKMYFWDQITDHNEEISAFIRVNAILKIGCANQRFSGLVFFTSKQMYLVRITNKEIDDDPSFWLQNYESVLIEKIKLIKPVLRKQGFSVNTEVRLPTGENVSYIILLYDQRRTEDFLSFVKDRGIVHVQETEDSSETRELISSNQIPENIRNLTVTDTIVVRHDKGGDDIYNFVALLICGEEIFILKVDEIWSSLNEVQTPAILCQERITNLVNVEETEDGISLQFDNEKKREEKLWLVSTVSHDSTSSIISVIQELWENPFDVQLPISRAIIN